MEKVYYLFSEFVIDEGSVVTAAAFPKWTMTFESSKRADVFAEQVSLFHIAEGA